MAIKKQSLEEYLKQYKAENANKNLAKTAAEFAEGNNPEISYSKSLRGLITKSELNGAGYGRGGEELSRMGLATSGYRDYLSDKAAEALKSGAEELNAVRLSDYAMIKKGYEDYLSDYQKQQTDIRGSLVSHLLKNGIMRLKDSFSAGIEWGLSANEAASVSAEVYGILRDRVTNECLAEISNLRLSPDNVREYAERRGLIPEDVDRLVKKARSYRTNLDASSERYEALINGG